MSWIEKAKAVIAECECKDYTISIYESETTGLVYLQARYIERDTVTGVHELQRTRCWPLSPEMTRSELVQTAFKCVMTSMAHRAREWFLYRGRDVFGPHHDVDELWAACIARDQRVEVNS